MQKKKRIEQHTRMIYNGCPIIILPNREKVPLQPKSNQCLTK